MRHLNEAQKRQLVLNIRQAVELAYGTEKCYQCDQPCTGEYTLPICEDPEPTAGINAPFCETCFNNSVEE